MTLPCQVVLALNFELIAPPLKVWVGICGRICFREGQLFFLHMHSKLHRTYICRHTKALSRTTSEEVLADAFFFSCAPWQHIPAIRLSRSTLRCCNKLLVRYLIAQGSSRHYPQREKKKGQETIKKPRAIDNGMLYTYMLQVASGCVVPVQKIPHKRLNEICLH